VASIRLEGVSLFAPEALLAELANKEGGPYFPPNVQRDVGLIESAYLDRGVRGTEVLPRAEMGDDHQVALVYEIAEGQPFVMGSILVSGNNETKPRVINRELLVAKGDVADQSRIQESRRRLERLGLFSEVRVEEIPTEPGREVLVVTVREGEKNYAGVGLGFESRNRVSGSLATWPDEFRPRGTAEYIRSNVFGLGAQFGLVGQLSTVERRAVASWNQPYLFGLAMPTTLLAWAEREDRVSFKFDRRGVSLNTIKSLGAGRLLLASLSLTRTAIFDVSIEDPPDDIDRRYLPYSAAMASVSVSWDKRDDTLNPVRGHFFSLVGEWGFPVFGMESDYQKIFLKTQFFRPLSSSLNLSLTGRLGIGRSLRNLPERFFAGGSNTFRGEEFDMLGPVELATDGPPKPLGGEAVFLVNTELLFPLVRSWRELRIAAFFDLGNVYGRLKDFQPFDLQGAAGAGIRYRTPLGPVRLEVAWKLWDFEAAERKGKPLFFLTIGNIF
jgi:outer membrane protein insertion porin family